MEFKIVYKGMAFSIAIMVILVTKSESKKERTLYDETDDPYSSLSGSSAYILDDNMSIQTSRKKRITPAFTTFSLSKNTPKMAEKKSSLKSHKSLQAPGECPPLRQGTVLRELLGILTPEIFSQSDPFRYLVQKTKKLTTSDIPEVRMELDKLLQFNRLPQCYIPYAETLLSLLQCWPDFEDAKQYILEIKKQFPPNDKDSSFLPTDMSSSVSSELQELFSNDFFDDPTPPMRLFYWLLDIAKRSYLTLEVDLDEFIEKLKTNNINRLRNQFYIRYAQTVSSIIQTESAFHNMKRRMMAIQKKDTSDREFMPATSILSNPSEMRMHQSPFWI